MPDSFFSEPDHDLDGTQPVEVDATRHLPPPPPGRGHVQLPSRPQQPHRREKRKRQQRTTAQPDARKSVELKRANAPRDRSKSGLYLPAWSVLLMLGTVFVVAFGIIALVIALGGGAEPGGSPRIIIITAVPSDTPIVSSSSEATPTARSIFSSQGQPTSDGSVPVFPLEGPTLPPVVLSPTPLSIVIGGLVSSNVDGLNVRDQPSTDGKVVFNANEGEIFTVVGGPEQGLVLNTTGTWWQIQDPDDSSHIGWAFQEYLDV
ncbi:MAG TPA: SH3 domain-containing protein, partial [Oceanobacillus sp.]|nr:SH3 domain-containing protein [Oceanobacillus sp.]